jgi:N-acetylneuraminic acid mutarotase
LWKYENDQWAYISGHTTATNTGVYGTQGVAAGGNQIGSRFTPAIWVKGTDIYVFGGAGIDSAGAAGELNDLWKFDGTNWTWLGGSQTKDPAGNYTAFNTFSSVALPSGRHGSTYYVDPNNPTLFHVVGGKGIDPQGVGGATTYYLNDHWVYNSDTNQWKWIGGNNQINPAGSFGSSGVIQASNLMSGREGSANWIVNKFLYVFAGFGVDSAGNTPRPSDFWRYSN